jgi:hypothetical protein
MRDHEVVGEGSGIELLDQKGATNVEQLGGFDGRELGMEGDQRYPLPALRFSTIDTSRAWMSRGSSMAAPSGPTSRAVCPTSRGAVSRRRSTAASSS